MTLSGGMKRRVLIAKALVARAADPVPRRADRGRRRRAAPRHVEDGPRRCARRGVTIILTTHYIEEAEEMADRIGVINKGELILVEEKAALMQQARQEAAHAAAASARSTRLPESLARLRARAHGRRQRARLHLRRAQRAHRHHDAAAPRSPTLGIALQGSATRRRARSRRSSSAS